MPRPHTLPTLFDDLKTVSISFLSKHGYLKPNNRQSGSITWSRDGNKTGSISINVNTQPESSYLELDYKCNEVPIKYRVQLVSTPSNLGKGVVWFFICPSTGKRCRKLYLKDAYFQHRSALKGCMYEKQTQSKKNRQFFKTMGIYFQTDQLFEQLYKKHFKKQYAGRATKKYLKLSQQIQRAESAHHEIERALIS